MLSYYQCNVGILHTCAQIFAISSPIFKYEKHMWIVCDCLLKVNLFKVYSNLFVIVYDTKLFSVLLVDGMGTCEACSLPVEHAIVYFMVCLKLRGTYPSVYL